MSRAHRSAGGSRGKKEPTVGLLPGLKQFLSTGPLGSIFVVKFGNVPVNGSRPKVRVAKKNLWSASGLVLEDVDAGGFGLAR